MPAVSRLRLPRRPFAIISASYWYLFLIVMVVKRSRTFEAVIGECERFVADGTVITLLHKR